MIIRTFNKTSNPGKLQEELVSVGEDLLDSISFHEEITSVFLKREPTGIEDAAIATIVSSHVPNYINYKIWGMVQEASQGHTSPVDINFSLLPLAKKREYLRGELEKITYYRSAQVQPNGNIDYSDPVLETVWTYTRDPLGYAVYAEETAHWYKEDETIGIHTKVIPHYYDGLQKIQEGIRRRSTILENMMIPVSEMIVYNETVRRMTAEGDPNLSLTLAEVDAQIQKGRDFMTQYDDELSGFVKHADNKILTSVADDTDHAFLNDLIPNSAADIRYYILNELNIWSEA